MKLRIKSEIKKALILILCGFIYYIIFEFFSLSVPCVFNKLTGFLCPSCGITRMIAEIVHFNFAEAFSYNKALFILLPVIVYIFIYEKIRYIKSGNKSYTRLSNAILWICCALLVLFGIIRNIV